MEIHPKKLTIQFLFVFILLFKPNYGLLRNTTKIVFKYHFHSNINILIRSHVFNNHFDISTFCINKIYTIFDNLIIIIDYNEMFEDIYISHYE